MTLTNRERIASEYCGTLDLLREQVIEIVAAWKEAEAQADQYHALLKSAAAILNTLVEGAQPYGSGKYDPEVVLASEFLVTLNAGADAAGQCDKCELWFVAAKMHETIHPRTGKRDSLLCDDCAGKAWESRQEDMLR